MLAPHVNLGHFNLYSVFRFYTRTQFFIYYQRQMKLLQQNAINELELLIKMKEADIVYITEIWLKDTIPDDAIDFLGMNLCRHDRVNGAGGGVAIFINNRIPFKGSPGFRKDLGNVSFECICMGNYSTSMATERDI